MHCSPVHPHHIYLARLAAGLAVEARPAPPALISGLFFEIPLQRTVAQPVLWYAWRTMWANGSPDEVAAPSPPEEEFEIFEPARYAPLPDVPEQHRRYLVERRAANRPALAFVHIPHVLVAGAIVVRDCPVIHWDEQPSPK